MLRLPGFCLTELFNFILSQTSPILNNGLCHNENDEINVPIALSAFRDNVSLGLCIEGLYSPANRTWSPQGFAWPVS